MNEDKNSAAVPTPKVALNEENKNSGNNPEQEDGPYKTWNFSRWSDTNIEDGTSSLSFLKMWKTEEEKAKMREAERLKLLTYLKQEIKKKSNPEWTKEMVENPFKISKEEISPHNKQ